MIRGFFRDEHPELYQAFSGLIEEVPDFRDPTSVARYPNALPWNSEEVKWTALRDELGAISSTGSSSISSRLLERGQGPYNYVFFNYPTALRDFLVAYPTLSWIMIRLTQAWRELIIAALDFTLLDAVTTELVENAFDKITLINSDITQLFDACRSASMVMWMRSTFPNSTEGKRLSTLEAKIAVNPVIRNTSMDRGKFCTFVVAFYTVVPEVFTIDPPIRDLLHYKVTHQVLPPIYFHIDPKESIIRLYNKILNPSTIYNFADIPSSYWRTIAKNTNITDLVQPTESNYKLFLYWAFKHGYLSTNSQTIPTIKVLEALAHEDEYIFRKNYIVYSPLLMNYVSIAPLIQSQLLRDAIGVSYYEDLNTQHNFIMNYKNEDIKITTSYGSNSYVYLDAQMLRIMSLDMLINKWYTIMPNANFYYNPLKDFMRSKRKHELLRVVDELPTIAEDIHRAFIKYNDTSFLELLLSHDRRDIISRLNFGTSFIINYTNISVLIIVGSIYARLGPHATTITTKLIYQTYEKARYRGRDDVCDYIRLVLL